MTRDEIYAQIRNTLVTNFEIPEERVHFIQYGLMAWLARGALGWSAPPLLAYLGAFLLASGVGYVDELVQGILPSRLYDLRDVLLNMQAAFLGVVLDEIVHDRLGWRRRSPDGARADRR